ncbi:MAG: GNAT family N-acetyltransferase [Clostridia bacterium]|nr:GNAT family N-acetyltransferase [Clostridia bacterium]
MSLVDDILIRPMVAEDEDLINEFFDAMGGEARAFFNRFGGNQKNTLHFVKNPEENRRYWMAELDGKMAGYVFLWDLHTSIPWLGIAVREDLKGKRLGRRLIAHAQSYVRDTGKGGIQLTTHLANIRGQVLYETMGFQRMGIHGASGEFYYLWRFED